MAPRASANLELRDYHPAQRLLVADLLRGLRQTPKSISPMYFYDETGSRLFDRICELPEYYLTRTETQLLRTHARQIAASIGPDALFVEFGSGASLKTRLVLDCLIDPAAYVPVDISRNHLLKAARAISVRYPQLQVLPVCADFTQPFALPQPRGNASRAVAFFPGSTLGNFDFEPAVQLLRVIRKIVAAAGGLLIGIDLVKDIATLESAYNDSAGITAAFNLNVLKRLNHEFGANFDVGAFRHRAVWIAEHSRIEMHLVSTRTQQVRMADEVIALAANEPIVTEHCHKYTLESFAELAARAGWRIRNGWTHAHCPYSVQYLEAASA